MGRPVRTDLNEGKHPGVGHVQAMKDLVASDDERLSAGEAPFTSMNSIVPSGASDRMSNPGLVAGHLSGHAS